MENKINVIEWPPRDKKVCKVYLIDEDGFFMTKTGYIEEDLDERTMINCCDYEHPNHGGRLKPKWDREKKQWIESASPEEVTEHREKIFLTGKTNLIESVKKQTSSLCLAIASELEQSNWINFPEDYDPSEIEEKRKQIREIRTKGREIREKLESAQTLEELQEIDITLIPPPVE